MSFAIDFVRLTIKEGAKDRFLTCQTFDPPPEKTHMGRLFVMVEISKKWLSAAQIGQRIVGQFGRGYYQFTSTSDLENFEQSVAQVNTLLSSASSLGETDWIGNLHCALMLVNETNIHAATIGDMAIWLLRSDRFSYITEPTEPEEADPSKVFDSIISGTLQNSDRLFIGSSRILDTFSKSEIHQLIKQNALFESGLALAQSTRQRRIKEAVALLIESNEPDQISTQNHPSVIYLDQPIQTLRHRLLKHIKAAPHKITSTSSTVVHRLKTSLGPKTRHLSSLVIEKTRSHGQKIHSLVTHHTRPQLQKIFSSFKKTRLTTNSQQTSALPRESLSQQPPKTLIGKTLFTIHDYRPASISIRYSSSNIFLTIMNRFSWFMRFFRHRTPKKFHNLILKQLPKKSWSLVGAIILLTILVSSTVWQKKQSSARQQVQHINQQLEQANKRFEDGKSALIFNNRKEAQEAFAESIDLAQKLRGQKVDQSKVDQIVTESQHELDKLINATRFTDIKPVFSLSDTGGIIVYNGRFFVTGTKQASMLEFNFLENKPDELAALSTVPLQTQPMLSENITYIITPETIEKINLDTKQVTVFTNPNQTSFSTTKNMGIFASNLYTLEPEKNRISKYIIQGETLVAAGNYVKSGDVSNGISLAIDGAIYVLKQDGTVLKLSRGEKQDFKLKDIPKPHDIIEGPLQIDTDESTSSIFVADVKEHRILEFDKTGKYLHQFMMPSDKGDLKSVFYQLKSRKAWVVLGSEVYEINL